MKVELLKVDRLEDFINYCKKYRIEIDDSFLYDEDLRDFKPSDDNPTYIITDYQGEIKATASLIIDDYNKRGKKARFRIFHSEIDDILCYQMLLHAILKHTKGLDYIIVFVPLTNDRLKRFIEELEFTVDRYSFLLLREELDVPQFDLPEDYDIRPLIPGRDEQIWCDVRNAGFAKLKGSETPITREMVSKMILGEDNIDGGSVILYHKEIPVGIVRCAKDCYEGSQIMNIGPLAIIPEYQGKGLGRALLRASLNFAKEKSYNRTILCVNADNDRAKSLYIQEGFKQVEAVACYKYSFGD